jgi:zinc protease
LERAKAIRNIAARGEVPITVALDTLHERLYPVVGAAHNGLGEISAVAGVSLEQIERFHAAHYLPNCTVISVTGGTTAEECNRVLVEALAHLLPGARPQEPPAAPPQQGPERVQLGWPGASGVYTVGGRAVTLTSPIYPAAATAMSLLGSGMDSRLYKALRRDRALAYTIVADITPSVIAPSASVLVTCDADKLGDVGRVVEREIERLTSKPPADEELRRAKQYLLGRHALRHQRNSEIAHYLGVFELLGGAAGYRLDTLLPAKIAAVGAEAVRDAMATIFQQMVVVRVGGQTAGP